MTNSPVVVLSSQAFSNFYMVSIDTIKKALLMELID